MQHKHKFNEKGCLIEWNINGENIIEPWGFETADSYSFFSQETGGYRNKIVERKVEATKTQNNAMYVVEMGEGRWRLNISEKTDGRRILRRHTLTILEDSFLMDYVSRFCFRKKFFDIAVINGREIQHRKTNLYYQHPVREVELRGDRYSVKIKIDSSINAGKFREHMYVRDYEDVWVVHARLLPIKWDKEVIKICRRWYNKAIPKNISGILLRCRQIRDYLWYRGETRQPNFPVNAYPIVKLAAGDVLELTTEVELTEQKII